VGHEVTLGPPIAVPANLPLNNELAVVMPLITPTCEPLIAVTYAADGKPGSR
ncbi:MAG: hypothetical protein H7Z43_02110, partial [Clostridia bacterium]|nr:hypothetical protein [Deltaproteobacteria bacterium]